MDTEILSQRLFEFRTLLDKLQQVIDLPAAERRISGSALENLLKQVLWLFEADQVDLKGASEGQSDSQENQLLHWLLKSEQRLIEESQQQIVLLQTILQNNPAGLAVVSGHDMIFQVATAAYKAIVPYPQMDLIGRSYLEVWPPDQGFDGDRLLRQLLTSGKNLQFERFEQRYPSGMERSFSLRICRLTWQGQAAALILIQETTQADRAHRLAMDIASEAHRQAEELDAIIMAMAEAMAIFDSNGLVIRANPAAIELFGIDPVGLDRPELIDLLSMRNPDGGPVRVEDLPSERALRGETIIGQRLLTTDSDGRERITRVSASPLFNETGVSAVVTVWYDVTEREHLLEQLEIEQSRLETIIKNAPEAIIVADEEGRLVLGNPAAERILGRAIPYGQEIENYAALEFCYNDGTPYHPRNLPLIISALDGETMMNIEQSVRLPNGQIRNLLVSTAPIVDRKGNLNGAVGVLQDITRSKQAEEDLRRQAGRSQLLATLSRAFAEAGLNYRELLDTVTRQIGQVFGDVCSLTLFTEDEQWFYPASIYIESQELMSITEENISDMRLPANQGMTGRVFQTGQPVILTDLPSKEFIEILSLEHRPAAEQYLPEMVNSMIVPLRAHGRWVGTIILMRLHRDDPYTHEDQTFLQDLADRAALAIEDIRLYEREAQRARELQALHRATTALLSTIDLETLLAQILEAAQEAISAAEQGALYLVSNGKDVDSDKLEIRAAFGCRDLTLLHTEMQAYANRAALEKRPMLFNDIQLMSNSQAGQNLTICSAIIAPLMRPGLGEQSVLGALALFGPCSKLFNENDLRLLDSFAATATAALQNATLYAEVQRLATTDPVTEQYNRRKFFELGELEMYRFRRFHAPLSAIMLDLDNFKEINDTYGHGAGDVVLKTVAQRCRINIRIVDILGRYGGDEFAILLPGADIRETREIAERIRLAVTMQPVPTSQGHVAVSISLGVAQAGAEMEHLSTLLGRADTALYAAKQGGRNRVMQDQSPVEFPGNTPSESTPGRNKPVSGS